MRLNVTAGRPGKPGLVWMSAAPLQYPTASVRFGIVPVVQIDSYQFPVGAETQNLIRWLEPTPPPGIQYRFKDYGKVRR